MWKLNALLLCKSGSSENEDIRKGQVEGSTRWNGMEWEGLVVRTKIESTEKIQSQYKEIVYGKRYVIIS
jgi:hypothetical protein